MLFYILLQQLLLTLFYLYQVVQIIIHLSMVLIYLKKNVDILMEPLLLLLIIFLLNLIQLYLKILHLDFLNIYLFINMLLMIKILEHLNNQVNLLILLDQTNLFNYLFLHSIFIIIHLILIFLNHLNYPYYYLY